MSLPTFHCELKYHTLLHPKPHFDLFPLVTLFLRSDPELNFVIKGPFPKEYTEEDGFEGATESHNA